MSVLWPNKTTVNPTFVQILFRIIHWACAAAAIYFIYRTIAYLVAANGQPDWNKFTTLAGLAAGLWLGGRGLRFILGRE